MNFISNITELRSRLTECERVVENPKADNSGTVVILHSVNHQSEIQELLRYSFVFLPFFVFTALKAELMDAKDRLTTSEKEIESLKNSGNYS